ncbi:unnamed protein product [Gordionus sp. m RMFG-2023]
MISEENLKNEFETFNIKLKSENIINRILLLCHLYAYNEENFVSEWMAYSLNNDINEYIDDKLLDKFESDILLMKKIAKTEKLTPNKSYLSYHSLCESPVNEILKLYSGSNYKNTSQCDALVRGSRDPLVQIEANILSVSGKRRLDNSTSSQIPLSTYQPIPSANGKKLTMVTTSARSSLSSTPPAEDLLRRAMNAIDGTAPSTSGSQMLNQNNQAMDLWENQLLVP